MTAGQPRYLQVGEEAPLLELLADVFGEWPAAEIDVAPLDHLRWKTERGHSESWYRPYGVEREGRLIAGGLRYIRQIKLGGRARTAVSGADIAVLPAHREHGVYSMMADWSREIITEAGYELAYGHQSGHPALRRSSRQRAATKPFRNYIEVLVAHLSEPPDNARASSDYRIEAADALDERADALWAAASTQFEFIPARTRDYLNWRYCDQRAGIFGVTVAEDEQRMLGYIASRVSHGRGYIADILVLPDRLDVVASLTRETLLQFAATGITTVDCWIPMHHPYKDTLVQQGFGRTKTTRQFSCGPLKMAQAELAFIGDPHAAIHLTAGDTDLV